MRLVIDTNIIFSAVLNSESAIAQFIILNEEHELFCPDFLWEELDRKLPKLVQIAKIDQGSIQNSIENLKDFLTTVALTEVGQIDWERAIALVKDIDTDDAPFVAMALHCGATLWTGDLHLLRGLQSLGFDKIISTRQLLDLSR